MTESTFNFDLAAERQRLAAEVARLRVERETGVPAELLTSATTVAEARELADSLLAWKGPPPQSQQQPSGPSYGGVTQYRRDDLQYLTADEVSQAYRKGRLTQIGAPAPPQRNSRGGLRNSMFREQ
jgi:hypothetical protein